MASVRILSVNCQGLGNIVTDVFNYLKKKQCNIYCLQDTHFTCENEKSIRSSWDYECYFSLILKPSLSTLGYLHANS
jgi:exonuclease III